MIEPDKLHLIVPVFRAYRRVSDYEKTASDDKVFQALREYEEVLKPEPAAIRALMLFDTVSSLIRFRRLAYNLRKYGSLAEFGTHASVNSNVSVRIVTQALALNECRSLFRPQYWAPIAGDREGKVVDGAPLYFGNNFRSAKKQRKQYVRQRWFTGYHSDVGGSPPENESGLGKLSLLWMIDALASLERTADAEDNAARKKSRLGALPKPRRYGLALRNGARKRYFEGAVADARTPGGLPYAGPDADAPSHNSHTNGMLAPIWVIMEFFPKSVARREPGPVAWYRRAYLWRWYFPLFEPRHVPEDHEVDPSVKARKAP